jgi:hypothetical protein
MLDLFPKTKETPEKTGSSGTVRKSFRKHLKNITENTSRNYRQAAILATAHILRELLM